MRWLALALAATAMPLGAQETGADSARLESVALPVGTVVRMRLTRAATPTGTRETRLARVEWTRADSLRVRWVRQADARTLAWSQVAGLDTLGGRGGNARNVRVGTIVGAALGMGAGLFVGGLAAALCEWEDCPSGGDMAVIAAVPTLLAATAGGAIGASIPGARRWAPVGTPASSRGDAPECRRRSRRHVLTGMVVGSVISGALIYAGYEGLGGWRLPVGTVAAGGVLAGAVPGAIVGATACER